MGTDTPPRTIVDYMDLLDAMDQLVKGWDSYRAEPPTALVREEVLRFLILTTAHRYALPEAVHPSTSQGVWLSYSEPGTRTAYVEFTNRMTATVLFTDQVTGYVSTLKLATGVFDRPGSVPYLVGRAAIAAFLTDGTEPPTQSAPG